jgi:hypothetical protein
LEPFSSRHMRTVEARPDSAVAAQPERPAQPRRRGFMPRLLDWATTASTANRLQLSRLQAPPTITDRGRGA